VPDHKSRSVNYVVDDDDDLPASPRIPHRAGSSSGAGKNSDSALNLMEEILKSHMEHLVSKRHMAVSLAVHKLRWTGGGSYQVS
jgi:hypothetical protein